MAKVVIITFNHDELQSIGALFDAAVKATGLQGAKAALPILARLEAAVAAANAKPEPQETE